MHELLKVRATILKASLFRMWEETDWGSIPDGKEKEELTSKCQVSS